MEVQQFESKIKTEFVPTEIELKAERDDLDPVDISQPVAVPFEFMSVKVEQETEEEYELSPSADNRWSSDHPAAEKVHPDLVELKVEYEDLVEPVEIAKSDPVAFDFEFVEAEQETTQKDESSPIEDVSWSSDPLANNSVKTENILLHLLHSGGSEESERETSNITISGDSKPNSQTSDKPFKCDICQKGFCRRIRLNRHMLLHSGIQPFKCDICQKGFSCGKNLTIHVSAHSGVLPCTCDLCGKGFTRKSNLNRHMLLHTNTKPFDSCQKELVHKSITDGVLLSHSGAKQFKCNVCDKEFVSSEKLKNHLRVHTYKPFKCNVCQLGFDSSAHRDRHLVVHTGLKSFKCNVCQKEFSFKGSLNNHMFLHSDNNPFKCNVCQKQFGCRANLKKHMIVHTRLKPFECNVCQKKFGYKESLSIHLGVHS